MTHAPSLRGCALAASAVLASFAGYAQQTLAPVVVTATGFEQELKAAPASITVITREELAKQPFRDLTDALRHVEGVAVTGPSKEQDIYIRGLPGAYTLILVDGKRQSTRDARTNGNAGFEQSFIPPLEAIERIEIVRGPMSSLYGSDAMGGVINVITRKVPRQWGGSVGVDATFQEHGDSGNAQQGQFFLGGPIQDGVVGLQLWGRQYQRGEDAIPNGFAEAQDRSLTARLAVTPNARHEILLEAGTSRLERSAAPGRTLAPADAATHNENDRDHGAISHTGRFGWGRTDIALSYEKGQRRNSTRDATGTYAANPRSPRIENLVLDAKATVPVANHLVVVGTQFNRATLTDQNPGRRTGLDEQFRVTQRALFVEDEWTLSPAWTLTSGLRLDDHESYGAHWSPRLYSVYQASEALTLKGGVSRGFRAPEVRTVAPGYAYTTGGGGCTYGPAGTCGVILGDPDLKAETSTSWELAALWDQGAWSGSATLFYTDFKDKISNALVLDAAGSPVRWAEDPNYRLWYSYNIDNAKIAGTELSLRWQASKALAIQGGYTFTDSRQKGGAYDGRPLARTPRHLFNLRGDWQASEAVSLWSAFLYHGKEVASGARIGSAGTEIATGVREYGSYGTFDIGASWALRKNTKLDVALYNVGDKRLDEQTYNTVGDGRRLWVGLTQRF